MARSAVALNARLRALVIHQLSAEGWTRRQIAALTGVSHQRVSQIVRPAGPADRARYGTDA